MIMLFVLTICTYHSLSRTLLIKTDHIQWLLVLLTYELLSQIFLHYLTIIIGSHLNLTRIIIFFHYYTNEKPKTKEINILVFYKSSFFRCRIKRIKKYQFNVYFVKNYISILKALMSSSLISLINAARTNPDRIIASMYSDLKPMYKGTILNAYGKKIQTFQGVEALNDLKKFMEAVPRGEILVQSPSLYKAAMSIAMQKGSKGETTHQKPRIINQKVQASSNMTGKVGQLICLGTNSAEEALTYFLIDDGLMSRKRRRMLFDPAYRYIGVGTSPHATYGTIAVVLLAQKIAQ